MTTNHKGSPENGRIKLSLVVFGVPRSSARAKSPEIRKLLNFIFKKIAKGGKIHLFFVPNFAGENEFSVAVLGYQPIIVGNILGNQAQPGGKGTWEQYFGKRVETVFRNYFPKCSIFCHFNSDGQV